MRRRRSSWNSHRRWSAQESARNLQPTFDEARQERVSKPERRGSTISRNRHQEGADGPIRVEWLMCGDSVFGEAGGHPQCVSECRVGPVSQGDRARGHQHGHRARAGLGGAGRGAWGPPGCRSHSVPASGLCPHHGPFVKTPSRTFLICVFSICSLSFRHVYWGNLTPERTAPCDSVRPHRLHQANGARPEGRSSGTGLRRLLPVDAAGPQVEPGPHDADLNTLGQAACASCIVGPQNGPQGEAQMLRRAKQTFRRSCIDVQTRGTAP